MSTNNHSENEGTTPHIFQKIWNNWQHRGGLGRCQGCPAHWSIREDFPGKPEDRDSSYQHRPLYAEGNLDADIAIIAREPGKPQSFDEDQNRLSESFENVRHSKMSFGGTIKYAEQLFRLIEDSEWNGYYTQIRKCNELVDGDNEAARDQCCGTGEFEGYLREELETVDPNYVITLGVPGFKKFSELFDIEDLGPDLPSKEFTKGSYDSGLRVLSSRNENIDFKVFPAPHPDPRGARWVYNRLDIEVDTRGYYKLFAEDVLRYIRENNQ